MSEKSALHLPALDPKTVPAATGTGYPEPYRAAVAGRSKQRLGNALGLKNFGVNLVRLPPGAASSQRHWHSAEDEFIYMLEGELELVTDVGIQLLRPGMAAGFPAGRADGHQLINRSKADAVYLEVGDRRPGADEVEYPDIDMRAIRQAGKDIFVHKDGKPW